MPGLDGRNGFFGLKGAIKSHFLKNIFIYSILIFPLLGEKGDEGQVGNPGTNGIYFKT